MGIGWSGYMEPTERCHLIYVLQTIWQKYILIWHKNNTFAKQTEIFSERHV